MFKKCFVLILLIVLAVRPIFYVGNVLYYQTHINEIVEKYCVNKEKPQLQCNGKCHLAKQISFSAADEETQQITKISTAFYPVFYQEIKHINMVNYSIKLPLTYFTYCSRYTYLSVEHIHKPPIV